MCIRDRGKTIVVFDGKEAPRGLDRVAGFAGITVMFSRPGTEADDLIEELILADSAPRSLLVVSSDHRIQRAAARRQAKSIDSDVWYRQQRPKFAISDGPDIDPGAEMSSSLSESDVAGWLKEFGPVEVDEIQRELEADTPRRNHPTRERDQVNEPREDTDEEADQEKLPENFNPFPDGYGEDLLE